MVASRLEVIALKYKQDLIKITMMDSNFSVDESELLTRFTKTLDELMSYCRISQKQNNFNTEVASAMVLGEYEDIVSIAMKDNKLSFEENQLISHIRRCLSDLEKVLQII